MAEGKKPEKMDLPHSESGHNPYWCGGDYAGQANGDDPCWGCINFFLASHAELVKALEAAEGGIKLIFELYGGEVEAPMKISAVLSSMRVQIQNALAGSRG